jgi:TonB family protein
MDTKKVILWPVLISFVGHLVLITVTGMIDLRENVSAGEIITVNIKEPETEIQTKKEEKAKEEINPARAKEEKIIPNDNWREETVDLGSVDTKYAAYLIKVKRKILRIWKYPQKAYENNKEGNVTVKMSIDANGGLAQTILITSSGSLELDAGTLSVVKTAAPFEPLPEQYNLSRLHIVASFRYKLRD